jgi:hypothetical protein
MLSLTLKSQIRNTKNHLLKLKYSEARMTVRIISSKTTLTLKINRMPHPSLVKPRSDGTKLNTLKLKNQQSISLLPKIYLWLRKMREEN